MGRASKRFSLVLIKPSHYDDDDNVILTRLSTERSEAPHHRPSV